MAPSHLDIVGPELSVPRGHRLGAQVLFGFAVVVFVTALAGGLILRNAEFAYLTERAQAENNTKFDLLLSATIENVVSEDLPQLETTLNKIIETDLDLNSIEVANERGRVLFSWRNQDRIAHSHWWPFVEPGHDLQNYAGEIVFAGERFGRISAAWNTNRTRTGADRHGTILAVSIFAVCVLLGLFGYLLVHIFIVTPVGRISRRVVQFRRGVFDLESGLSRFVSAELLRLDRSVDALARFLAHREAREAELKEAKEVAESASQAKSTFLAMMSHELRTPLNAINGFSEVLSDELHGPLGDPRYKDYAGEISASGAHLLALINDILDISKIEAGKSDLCLAEFALSETIAAAVRLARNPTEISDVEIIVRVATDLPSIIADERRIRQVLLNLLSNALKFTPNGGSVTITADWDDETGLVLRVADTGIGIAPENLALAQEPFRQVENVLSRRHQGTGLGLPLAKALVALHDGTLSLESELGAGTTVTITLPPGVAAPEAPGARASTA